MNPPNLTPAMLAARWNTSATFVYSLIQRGDLPAFKLGGKLYRIRLAEVEAYECRQLSN